MQSIEILIDVLKNKKAAGFCEGFLSASRLYDKRPNARQLLESLREAGYTEIANAADRALIHRYMTAIQLGAQIIDIYDKPLKKEKN